MNEKIRKALMMAAIDCGHTITDDAITLHRRWTAPGNALAQLSDRLVAACPQAEQPGFQQRVQPWMLACFGEMIAGDREERNHRFLEEALELVQSTGCTASEAHQLVDYVYGRPVGEPAQEVGGVMVTLAALCLANKLDMHADAEAELARIWTKVDQIRAKQAAKPRYSPLPQHAAAQPTTGVGRSGWIDFDTATPAEGQYVVICGIIPPDVKSDRKGWRTCARYVDGSLLDGNGCTRNSATHWMPMAESVADGGPLHPPADAASVDAEQAARSKWTVKQWYEHVGAWENAQGEVCFGSVMALGAMLKLMAKARHATQPAPAPADAAQEQPVHGEELSDPEILAEWEIVRDAGNFVTMLPATDKAIIAFAHAILAAHRQQKGGAA
ncbi:hypothetical protein [Duganella lactea]|uniref:hypothetical protein n=1 Tax=Duganella lactea TaxID=2692173 RepID=UPI001E639E13|nr:hypothetical protein [Duganella lactea]